MPTTQHRLIRCRDTTCVLVTTPDHCRAIHAYQVICVKRYGRDRFMYVDAQTGHELFPDHYFEDAGEFAYGYAPVVKDGRYYHIDMRGKVAYPWRFSDIGPMAPDGSVPVQHPRARGWSRFHVLCGTFIENPPSYRR